MLIDTHAHLTFPEFKADLPEAIKRAKDAGIEAVINIALDDPAVEQAIKLSEEHRGFIFTAAGLHPQEASQFNGGTYDKFKQLALDKKIIALGETGLDYFYKHSPIEKQQEVFRQFLRLAQDVNLPVIIHSRDAAADTVKILQAENCGKLKGVLHCFAGDMALGKTALEMGLFISFTGNITFPKAEVIRQAAKAVPLEKILIETDCPFLAPQVYRGKRNEPAFVVEVAKKIAEIKSLSLEEVELQTTNNARELFGLA